MVPRRGIRIPSPSVIFEGGSFGITPSPLFFFFPPPPWLEGEATKQSRERGSFLGHGLPSLRSPNKEAAVWKFEPILRGLDNPPFIVSHPFSFSLFFFFLPVDLVISSRSGD